MFSITLLRITTLIWGLVFLNVAALALPQPAQDGAGKEAPPLPGRTDYSVQKNGLITGYYGDDLIPKHMGHLQSSIAEFPRNADAYPYDEFGKPKRKIRTQGIVAGVELGSGEKMALDEKTVVMQDNKNWPTDTTVMRVPYYESGGHYSKGEQAQKERFEAENPGLDYHTKKLPEGAYKTEGGLSRGMENAVKQFEKQNPGKKATLQLKPNPGWLPFSSDQLRAHEAPGKLENAPFSKQPTEPTTKKGRKKTAGSSSQANSGISNPSTGEQSSLQSSSQQSQQPQGRYNYRTRPDRDRAPPVPKAQKPQRTAGSANTDPYGYERVAPTVPHYKPGIDGKLSKTPEIGPPAEKTSSQRVPPRPQNRDSGESLPRPKPKPFPASAPVPGGRTGKEGTSHEAPDLGKTTSSPVIDTSKWKPYGKGKGKASEAAPDLGSKIESLPLRLATQKTTGEAVGATSPEAPTTPRKDKETQTPVSVNSPVAGRLRSKQQQQQQQQQQSASPDAVAAAKKAMQVASNKKGFKGGGKSKRNLLVHLIRKRALEKSMSMMHYLDEL